MSRKVRNLTAALIMLCAVFLWVTEPERESQRMEERIATGQRLLKEEEFFLGILGLMEHEEKWRILEKDEWDEISARFAEIEQMSWYPEEQGLYLMIRTDFPAAQGYFLSRYWQEPSTPDYIHLQFLCRGKEISAYWREEGWD